MAYGPYYNATNKVVYDGDTAAAADLNAVNSATESALSQVANDLDDLQLAQQNWEALAEKWATDAQGVNPDPLQPTDYSAYANAKEAEGHASEVEDTLVTGADGASTGTYSALHHAAKSSASASAAATSEANAAASEAAALVSETNAAASEATCIAQNSILGGTQIDIDSVFNDPDYEFTVNHDVVGATDGTYPASPAAKDAVIGVEKDALGHIIGVTTSDHDLRYLGLTAKASDSDKLDGQHGSYYSTQTNAESKLPKSGGTMTGNITLSGANVVAGSNKWTNGSAYYQSGSTFYSMISSTQGLQMGSAGAYFRWDDLGTGYGKGIYLRHSNVNKGGVVATSGGLTTLFAFGASCGLRSTSGDVSMNSDGFTPHSDNVMRCGHASYRWSAVWAGNGSIQTSDETLKNIKDIGDVSWLYNLIPIQFKWKDGSNDNKDHYGFSAQDVESKIPLNNSQMIHTPEPATEYEKDSLEKKPKKDKDGGDVLTPYGMDQGQLIAPMLKLIQEQKAIIDNLEARVATLEGN